MATVRVVPHLVERMLDRAGPLPALCEEQRRLARLVAEALDAPPREEPLVSLVQAGTGVGKTIALLAPVMALASMQKRAGVPAHRALLSTATHHLTRQILDDDAPRVSRALAALGYPGVSVAARAGRRQYIDHDRIERALSRFADARDGPQGRSLEALFAFSTFAEAEDQGVFLPPGWTQDALAVTPRTRPEAAAAFDAARRAAGEADIVITNHALALTDCRLRGRVLGPAGAAETLLFDEADALPDVARSIADDRIELPVLRDVLGPHASAPANALERLCADETRRGAHRLLAHCPSRHAILDLVARIRDALERLPPGGDDGPDGEADLLRARLAYFIRSAERGSAIAAIAAGPTPALAVVHREPVRVLRRLLAGAHAALFASATLAAPAARPTPNDLLHALGIAPGMRPPARTRAPAWTVLEPRRFGWMRLRFADRAVSGPFETGRDPPAAHPAHLDYVASAIEEARKTGRVLVLATSHALVDELAARVQDPLVHRRGNRLRSVLDPFRANPRAVLITPAAWTGVSLPRMVDHVVIPRIPFRPDAPHDETRRDFLTSLGLPPRAATRLVANARHADARRRLAQGIGRGIRGPDDSCTVWLLDPRFPLPKSMARAIGGPGQGQAVPHLELIHCIPQRFRSGRRPAVDEGEIWPR